jgi:hypothetical protein
MPFQGSRGAATLSQQMDISAGYFPILWFSDITLCNRRHADTPTRRHADTPTRRYADTPLSALALLAILWVDR